jgi:hypothetical protein
MENLEAYKAANNKCIEIDSMIKKACINKEYALLQGLKLAKQDAFNARQACYIKLSVFEICGKK